MNAILTTFGVDWRLLLINAVNFGLLLAALTYFLYKPVMRVLEERRHKIAKGVEDAQAAEARLKEIEESRGARLAQAGQAADEIIASARASGSEKAKEIVASAQTNAERTLQDASAQAAEMKRRAVSESKEEVARLIVLGIERLAREGK